MDLLKSAAQEFQKLLSAEYYFEIARKNVKREFVLNFKPEDFHHILGLHKLIDIGLVQTGKREKVYFDITNNRITLSDVSISNYFDKVKDRMELVSHMQDILDSNQIIFKYLAKENSFSRIEADYLMEHAHRMDIVYIFLNERVQSNAAFPVMCCRSFFAMDKMDYSKNQMSYTLLKKVKMDVLTGEREVQYDRGAILDKAKRASSEPERKSIMQQLNEKKAQAAINDVLNEKKKATV